MNILSWTLIFCGVVWCLMWLPIYHLFPIIILMILELIGLIGIGMGIGLGIIIRRDVEEEEDE